MDSLSLHAARPARTARLAASAFSLAYFVFLGILFVRNPEALLGDLFMLPFVLGALGLFRRFMRADDRAYIRLSNTASLPADASPDAHTAPILRRLRIEAALAVRVAGELAGLPESFGRHKESLQFIVQSIPEIMRVNGFECERTGSSRGGGLVVTDLDESFIDVEERGELLKDLHSEAWGNESADLLIGAHIFSHLPADTIFRVLRIAKTRCAAISGVLNFLEGPADAPLHLEV